MINVISLSFEEAKDGSGEGVWDDVLMLWLLDWVVGSRYSLYHLKINDNERGFYMANDKSAPWSKDYN